MVEEFNRAIGANLKRMRKRRGWTAEDVSEKLNISLDTVYKYEAGKRMVPPDRLMQAAVLLNCSLLDIYAGLDPRSKWDSDKELNVLMPESSVTMRYLATEWHGDVDALVAYMGTVAILPEEIRREVYMDVAILRDKLIAAGTIQKSQLPPGTPYMEQQLGGLYPGGDRL